jgi:uncharacterized integral membrane protein
MEDETEPTQTPSAVSEPEIDPQPEPEPKPTQKRLAAEIGTRFYATFAAFLFFVGYSIAFIVGNSKRISVDFVFATARVSVIWMVVLLLAVGLVGGVLLVELYRHRRR